MASGEGREKSRVFSLTAGAEHCVNPPAKNGFQGNDTLVCFS